MSPKLTVAQFMTRSPHTIGADQPLSLAQRVMRANDLRHLPVLAGGKLVGIISDRDLAVIEAARRLDTDRTSVEAAMSANPYTVAPETSLVEVARAMAAKRQASAVVLENGNVVGIFTTVDALLALAHVLGNGDRRARQAAV